jgi:RNA-binding protein
MTLTSDNKKHLRRIGHDLKPVVTVADKGLTGAVIAEIDRALTDHELIKVKLAVGDRDAKKAATDAICERLDARAIQQVGHVLLLYRKADKPDPRLSNLLRRQDS